MEQVDTTEPKKKRRAPFWVLLICLIGFFGMIAVCLGQFTDLHPMLKPWGWAAFLGANLLLILNAIFRKKRSDITGEFHAYNMISWMVALMLSVGILLVIGLCSIAWAKLSNSEFSMGKLYAVAQYLAIVFALPVTYGWIRWFAKKS